jgi:hypothetical protein
MNQKEENKFSVIMTKARWVLPVALWAVLSFCSGPFLAKVEERSFFQFDLFWFYDFLGQPAGLLSWCGLFFTQFLHLPWLGALIWVLLLTLTAELTRIVFRISSKYALLTYLPAAIFTGYNMSMGYLIYLVNHPGFFFAPVLGYLWALLTVVVLRRFTKPATSLILILIWGFAGYYIAGVYGLAGVIVSAVDTAFSDRSRMGRILPAAGAVAVFILAPILFLGSTTYCLSTAWTLGIPDSIHGISLARMQLPIVIALVLLALAPVSRIFGELSDKICLRIQIASIVVLLAIPAFSWYKDRNFKTELEMIQAVEELDWEKVPKLFDQLAQNHESNPSWQPTRIMVALKDLALIKTGQEGNLGFGFDDGSMQQNTDNQVQMSMQVGWILGFHYGIPGFCQRWIYEESMLFGWSNMTFKYSTMTALLFGNTELADKYLTMLDKTIFYRKWAREQRKLNRDRSLLATTAPYDLILPLLCYDDVVLADQEGCETFIKRHFGGPSPENSTPLYDRVALYFAIKSKDPTLFWTRFFLYLESNNPKKIDRYYQEAAYLYSSIQKNGLLEALPFDDQVKDLYNSFTESASKFGPMNMEEAKMKFPANLRHTFFYYYYYVNNIKLF